MTFVDVEQGSDAWRRIRVGRATASRVHDIIKRTKTGWSTSRANYAAELIAERLTGVPAESFSSAAMKWGTEKEPEARDAYAFRMDISVQMVGFVPHPTIAASGSSSDGFCALDGEVQFKAPLTSTHLDTLQSQTIPAEYITQMQWGLACSRRKWCDYVSYDPRLPEAMRLFVKRVMRDNIMIADLERCVDAFLAEVADRVRELSKQYGVKPVAPFPIESPVMMEIKDHQQ